MALLALLSVGLAAALCVYWPPGRPSEPKPNSGENPHAQHNAAQYHCPMHPQYVSDRPGECPICGMTLVKIQEAPDASEGIEGRAAIKSSPQQLQMIGVRIGKAETKRITKSIRAAGRVEYDERGLSSVALKFGGWIERLDVNATGDKVSRGTSLLQVYSPDLLEAQRNYRIAWEARIGLKETASPDAVAFAEESLKSARNRLVLWDISPEQIRELESNRDAAPVVAMYSKVDGVVIRRNVTVGAYVNPGTELLAIADLSKVWIRADVYEYEAPDLKVGLAANLQLASMPGEIVTGKIVYIYPYMNESTRSVSIRFEVPNPDGRFKPGMYCTASIQVDLGEQLVVDDQAVLDSGERQIVFVEEAEGKFIPRQVVVGNRSDGQAVILKGLSEGDRVVTSGNFLIDSESRLKSALRDEPSGGGAKHKGHEH